MPRIDPDLVDRFEDLVSQDDYDPVNYWSEYINPKLVDMERCKKAALLTVASHGDQYGDRGRVHTLFEGEPGTGKSKLRLWLVSKLGAGSASQRTTDVGLTGDARGDEITPGALPKNDKGVLTIDELDEFKPKDRQGLLEAMSEGIVEIEAGGMSATMDARVRVVAAANSVEQFSPELLDRFDFHIQLDKPEGEERKEIAESQIDTWFREKDGYSGQELQQYLNWIRPYEPDFPQDAREKASSFIGSYIDLDQNGDGGVRQDESIIRVAYTIAKLARTDLRAEYVPRAMILVNPEIVGGLRGMLDNGMMSDEYKALIRSALDAERYDY